MKRAALLACALLAALAFVAPASASLIPPGASEKPRPKESAPLKMPAALSNGSRATTDLVTYFPTRATVSPAPARIGQRLVYRASILVVRGTRVRFDRPVSGGDLTWGDAHSGRTAVQSRRAPPSMYAADSAWIEAPLQVFATGRVALPGPVIEITTDYPQKSRLVRRLPTLQLIVLPTITAADTNAQLRALHGPIRAPWWERVPWLKLGVAAVLLAILAFAILWLLRRRRAPAVVAPAPRPVVARDPGAEALAELAKLRALRLPEAGRFGDHALALTRILRRYLEAVVGTPRPGDTSAELVARLRQSRLAPEDVARLEGLLGLWDRVKFARAPLDIDEARRCEGAVETLVRRRDAREVA